jgi:iron complex transport system substrate-binding protein
LVVLQAPEHQEAAERLKALGLQVLSVRQQSVAEILESIRVLGARCGADLAGRRMADELQARVAKVRERPCGPRPRVLVVVHRELGVGSIRGATLAGRGTFYDELLETAGAVNAFSTAGVPWPAVSAEGILKLDPDCIVELVPGLAGRGFTESAVLRDWESLSGLQAVKARRIRLLTGDYVARPGPRFARILEDLRNLPAGSPALQPPADPRR